MNLKFKLKNISLKPLKIFGQGIFFILKPILRPSKRGKIRLTVIIIFILAILAGFLDYPVIYDKSVDRLNNWLDQVPWLEKINLPHYLNLPFHLGLDLQGGTHLVYDADTSGITAKERDEALEGVRDVIERRVNALGVAEPIVQTNKSGEQWRIIVELAGVRDVQEAIKMIGETPLLEFKEENTDPARSLTPEEQEELDKYNEEAQQRSEEALAKALTPAADFSALVREYSEDKLTRETGGNIGFVDKQGSFYEIFTLIAEDQKLPWIINKVIEANNGYNIVKVEEKRQTEKEVQANHILICYKGADRCEKDTSPEDALAKIQELKAQAIPENFIDLAKENSTEPGAEDSGGSLGWFKKGQMVKPFEEAVYSLEVGAISEIVKTDFGYHLIYKIDERDILEYSLSRILIKQRNEADILPPADPWKNTQLSGQHLNKSVVQFDPNTNQPQVGLEFDDEGKKLFAEITKRNVNKLVAIFLDGYPISVPRVQEEIRDGSAVITGNFNIKEAKLLVQRLNAGALPVPITLINQQTVGATLGVDSVKRSWQAGLIGLLAVAIFMLLFYRLPGFLAVISLGIYGIIVLTIFKLVPVTLTVAGLAGFILSIGMAVDANILIFERLKEELQLGKPLGSAIDEGFRRAWPSIRDGNISTLITCVILGTFGTSIIKGFAVTLGIGVVISMFSAIISTKMFLHLVEKWTWKKWLYGFKNNSR